MSESMQWIFHYTQWHWQEIFPLFASSSLTEFVSFRMALEKIVGFWEIIDRAYKVLQWASSLYVSVSDSVKWFA